MRERHRRRLAQRERRQRKHQQRRGAALRRHAREPRGFQAAIGPDAVDQWQAAADLVLRDLEHAPLLLERAGGDLGRVRVDGNGGEAFDCGHVTKMLAEARLVDRQIVLERQQHRRDHSLGNIVRVPWHGLPPYPNI